MQYTGKEYESFLNCLWQHYDRYRRDMPWRHAEADGSFNPYKILVSEFMLQQTQVARVVPKFLAFISQFPGFNELVAAPQSQVLSAWSGLGYNRRAKFLHVAANHVVKDYGGVLPNDQTALVALPGIGVNTAAAIRAYAFNEPVLFIETNIRAVYIHHFFSDGTVVNDKQLLPLLSATLDTTRPREFYWALTDYGNYLKKTVGNTSRRSQHYTKQSIFEGSRRQIRGQVLKLLIGRPQSESELQKSIKDERLSEILMDLVKDELLIVHRDVYHLRD